MYISPCRVIAENVERKKKKSGNIIPLYYLLFCLVFILTEASGGWFAGKAWRALATEATRCVAANRSFSATTQKALGEVAFIDI